MVLLTTGAGVGAAWYFTQNQPPMYLSSATLVVGPSPRITNARETMEVYNTLDRRSVMATLSKMAASDAVMQAVRAEVPDAVGYDTTCVVVPDTNILSVNAVGPDPQTAGIVANAVARHSIPLASDMYESFQLRIMDPGSEARRTSPTLVRNLAAGAVLGLVAGVFLALLSAFLFGRARQKEKAPEDIEETPPAPLRQETGILRSNQL